MIKSRVIYFISFLLLGFIFVFIVLASVNNTAKNAIDDPIYALEGFTDSRGNSLVFPYQADVDIGSEFTISTLITRKSEVGLTLRIWQNQQDIVVKLDDEIIFEAKSTVAGAVGKVSVSGLHFIRLDNDSYGKELKITYTPVLLKQGKTIIPIYIGTKAGLIYDIIRTNLWNLIIPFSIFAIGILLCSFAFGFKKNTYIRNEILTLGIFAISSIFWQLAMSRVFKAFFSNLYFSTLFDSLALMLFPVFFCVFMIARATGIYKTIFKSLAILQFIVAFSACLLQYFSFIELAQTMILTYIIIVVVILLTAIYEISQVLKHFSWQQLLMTCFAGLLLIYAILELLFYNQYQFQQIENFFMQSRYLQFILVYGVVLGSQFANQAEKNALLQHELTQSQISNMLSQIKPHFLYNSLNSISSLCKSNPDKADEAIIHFSKFLRSNMKSIESSDPIPFTTELELVKNYIYLEQIRFPNIQVEYNLKYVSFDVPPLVIQPVVENAIKHGVSKNTNGGTVIIESDFNKNTIIITVRDNGVGFDTTKLNETTNVGLKNIKKRLQAICNADLTIESNFHKGTTVTITIPIVKESDSF